jgi:hypothetical protein
MKKRSIFFLVGFVFLLLAGVSPFFIFSFNLISTQKIERARTPLSPLLMQPTALVYSSDYFFNFIKIKTTDASGEHDIEWDDFVPHEMKGSYLYHIYLRHLFNGGSDLNARLDSIKYSLQFFACQNQSKLEIFKNNKPQKVALTISAAFKPATILKSIEVSCE